MTSYLIFSNLASAQARSHTQAVSKGCTGDTDYWWSQIENPSTGQAALVIEDAPRDAASDFSANGLTDAEKAALVPRASMGVSWSLQNTQ